MFNPEFIEKILLPYEIIPKEKGMFLAKKCKELNISPEFFLLTGKVILKDAIIKLNMVKKGHSKISKEEAKSLFNLQKMNSELEKLVSEYTEENIGCYPKEGQIIDKYKLTSVLGKGATATVYKATHIYLKTEVALKVLSPRMILDDPGIQDVFLEEAINSAKLIHPNLIRILDTDRRGKYAYIVMDLIEGSTLDDILKTMGTIAPMKVLKILSNLCKALQHALNLGLIHRDIKPGNIMITKKGEVKLADFGLAKIVNEPDQYQTISGQIYGTPYYMSPEQFLMPDKVDHRADLYSLGATIYHLVTGKLPFETNSIAKIIYMHVNQKPVAPHEINKEVISEFSDVIMKLLEKDPDKRYQNYSELHNDLCLVAGKYRAIVNNYSEKAQAVKINIKAEAEEEYLELMKSNPNKYYNSSKELLKEYSQLKV